MNKRAIIGMLSGGILGVLCVLGVYIRIGNQVTFSLLFAIWLNRTIMGMLIGFYSPNSNGIIPAVFRGAFFGLIVGLSLHAATDFLDSTGFIAGIVYGIITDVICTKYGSSTRNNAS